jgi:CheY-like chemotaxis protein
MPEEVRRRACEPFFTTKEGNRGSGLGLSQAAGFARQSSGSLVIDSAPGMGTTVTFHLPVASSRRAPEQAEQTERPGPVRRVPADASVLLVEDDAEVAEMALGLLTEGGYRVQAVPNAEAALNVLRTGAEVDLVLSDIMMPGGMNGAELAHVIRREFPGVFILLATGYAEAAAGRLAREFPLVMKPYGRDALLEKIAEILGDSA